MRSEYCDGIDRRGFLRMGSVAGLSMAQLLRLQAGVLLLTLIYGVILLLHPLSVL